MLTINSHLPAVAKPMVVPTNESNGFEQLVAKLKHVLGAKGLSSEDVDVDAVKQIMALYKSCDIDWQKYALHNADKPYTRNGVVDINGNANLLILVWSPHRGSAAHDHANAHCCMKILLGELQETIYEIPQEKDQGNPLKEKKVTTLHRDEVGYIADTIGLHKIENSGDEYAVSLHLYTPPYALMYGCSLYDSTGHKHHVDMSKYYSWQGQVIDGEGATC